MIGLRDEIGRAASVRAPTTHGGPWLIPEDGATFAHVYVRNAALCDTRGNIWTKMGTPAFVNTTAWGRSVEAITTFSDTSYYLGDLQPSWFTTGDFIVTAIVTAGASSGGGSNGIGICFSCGDRAVLEYYGNNAPSFLNQFCAWGSGPTQLSGVSNLIAGVPRVLSFGRAGGTGFMKVDASPVTEAPQNAGADDGRAPMIGRYYLNLYRWSGRVIELRCSRATPTVAVLDSLHAQIMAGG